MREGYDRITTTIEREWLAQIIAGTKKIEYRQIKPFWKKRFAKVSVPFELRLLNGRNPPVPEVTVLIHRITKDRHAGEYQLHIRKFLGFKHWDNQRQKPKRRLLPNRLVSIDMRSKDALTSSALVPIVVIILFVVFLPVLFFVFRLF